MTSQTSDAAQLAMSFGSGLLAARLGMTGYQMVLETVQSMTSATAAAVVRQAEDRRPHVLASTAATFEDGQDYQSEITQAFKSNMARRNTVWSTSPTNRRLWILPLGKLGPHDYSIVLFANAGLPVDFYHTIGEQARLCWQLSDQNGEPQEIATIAQSKVDVLGPENPYGLTNAERLVCVQLRKGARPKTIAHDTGKSIATIRTHLARVYSKTNCAGMVEVLHLLGTSPQIENTEVSYAA